MNELEVIERLQSEGFDEVYAYDAAPGEIDEEHQHDFDTKMVVLEGGISVTSVMGGAVTNLNYKKGSEITIPRNRLHSAKVGSKGCRYVVAERH